MFEHKTDFLNLLEEVPKYCKIKVRGFNPPLKLKFKMTENKSNYEGEFEFMCSFRNIEPSIDKHQLWKDNPSCVQVNKSCHKDIP